MILHYVNFRSFFWALWQLVRGSTEKSETFCGEYILNPCTCSHIQYSCSEVVWIRTENCNHEFVHFLHADKFIRLSNHLSKHIIQDPKFNFFRAAKSLQLQKRIWENFRLGMIKRCPFYEVQLFIFHINQYSIIFTKIKLNLIDIIGLSMD